MSIGFRALLALFLAVLAVSSHAGRLRDRHAEMEWIINGPGSATGNPITGGSVPSTRTYAPAPTGADIGGRKPMPWSPNKTQMNYMAAWKELASGRNIAKALMNPGSAAITLLGGTVLKQLIDEACVRVVGGTLVQGAVWDECKFTSQPATVWGNAGWSAGYDTSQALACEKTSKLYAAQQGRVWHSSSFTMNGNTMTCSVYINSGQLFTNMTLGPVGTTTVTVQDGYQTVSNQSVEDKLTAKLEQWCQSDFTAGLQVGKCTNAAKETMEGGLSVEAGPLVVTGPNMVPGDPQSGTTTHPDGTVIVKTTTTDSNYTYDGNTVKRVPTTTTTTTTTEPGSSPVTETTTETASDTRTACEINPASAECAASQPSAATPVLDGTKTADDAFKDLKDFVADPTSKLPSFPTLNWAFTLPTGCTAIALPAFDPWLQSIDICPFLPMFHDLMSVIWVIGALFGAISMFWRSTFSAN